MHHARGRGRVRDKNRCCILSRGGTSDRDRDEVVCRDRDGDRGRGRGNVSDSSRIRAWDRVRCESKIVTDRVIDKVRSRLGICL